MEDRTLVSYLKEDNQLAFEGIFRKYFTPLAGFARGYTGDLDLAKDIVQAVLLHIWEQRAVLDIHSSLKSYLFNAVRNSCLNELKKSKTQQQHLSGMLTETAADINSRMEYAELQQQLYTAIEKLPPECRRIFMMSRFEKLKYSEIAARQGISIKTVEAQVSKALRILRAVLAQVLQVLLLFF